MVSGQARRRRLYHPDPPPHTVHHPVVRPSLKHLLVNHKRLAQEKPVIPHRRDHLLHPARRNLSANPPLQKPVVAVANVFLLVRVKISLRSLHLYYRAAGPGVRARPPNRVRTLLARRNARQNRFAAPRPAQPSNRSIAKLLMSHFPCESTIVFCISRN